ncbi:hypothetical protein N1030_01750 [Desulfovibrio mangrovi]|uniref:hypothetical protein n=1 Tax=Desulfovibrio mangrovi TaxID=2976983 RepID=UPI002247ECF0|nr:hypothetical protein [Desulfovibrio mangrovi]UZP67719.1 hypothetical protein N1030_01750 [Desulfovibrio mangrovi]
MPTPIESIMLARAVIELVADVGSAAADAYVRHKEERGEPITAGEISAMISNHKSTREILAEMGIDI